MIAPTNFASIPELNRGVSNLYAQLREEYQETDGEFHRGFEKNFTSADGLVTVTLSAESVAAYKGAKPGDIGIHLKVLTRGPDVATSEGNALSDPIRSLDDVVAHESLMKQAMGPTVMLRLPDEEPLPQPSESETPQEKATGFSLAAPSSLKSKLQATNKLIEFLTAFLESVRGEDQGSLKSAATEIARGKSQDEARSSLFTQVDIKA